jgi:hypothetical protein
MAKVGRKTTEVEQFERIEEALELMLYKKLSTQEFRVTFSKMYGVTERTADNIWAKCKQILKDRFTENTDEIISEQLSRYYDLLDRARRDNNKRVERETLSDINKLYGLEQKKVDITSGGNPISINIQLED